MRVTGRTKLPVFFVTDTLTSLSSDGTTGREGEEKGSLFWRSGCGSVLV